MTTRIRITNLHKVNKIKIEQQSSDGQVMVFEELGPREEKEIDLHDERRVLVKEEPC